MKLCPKCQKQFSDDANFCPVDAARLSPLEAQATGGDSLAARFDLGARIGGNRTGAVHRAADKTTKQPVVVKLVAANVVGLPGVAQRLERELRQLERVQSAGVARVLASGKRNGEETWVAMELLEGAHTLAEAITSRGPIAPEQAADLIEVIGEALIEAAQVGVVHRDLAPKNVLFAGQDVKLINFSLPVPTTDKVPGVAEFVAPEQVDGRPVDQRSNLYSLGALYYFVLTGQTVFSGSADEVHRQHQSGTIRPPSQLIGGINPGSPIETVIMRALDRSPTKRFLTVRQFVDEVGRVGRGEVIELKSTIPQGSRAAARPKAELVSTLMGVRHGSSGEPAKPYVAPPIAPAIASAPTVGTGVPSVAAPIAQSKPANVMQSTMIGVSSGAHDAPSQPSQPIQAPPMQAAPMQAAPMMATPMPPKGIGSPDGSLAQAQPMPKPMQPQPAQMMQAQIVPDSAPIAQQGGSPWAAPASPVAAPIVAAPIVAAPVVAAPIVAAPVLAAPLVSTASPAGAAGKQKAPEPQSQKGKFRETMWFKKGDLDTQAAVAAAEERARTGKDVAADKADSLPMDERYKDDGSISRGDKEKYSLRTGATQMMAALRAGEAPPGASGSHKVSEDALIGEMKGGRSKVLIAIVIGVVAIVLLIVLVSR
jgi:serine/threonine protein kinase